MLIQEEQTRETTQKYADFTHQLQEIDDLTAILRDELDALGRETVRHFQSVLVTYQEAIQNIGPLIENKKS